MPILLLGLTKRTAFSLIELLVVLLLMGLVYAIAFGKLAHNTPSTQPDTLETIDRLFKASTLYKKETLTFVWDDQANGYLLSSKKREPIHLQDTGVAYRLNPDETVEPIHYQPITIDHHTFTPLGILRCNIHGYLEPTILSIKDRWLYIHPIWHPKIFSNIQELIAYAKKSDYLPAKAGYAQ